ncbi:uncharacterized protein LOC123714283 [Pieris brassicae]|uniref:uncharacterized protein LOC123714283 n=1 Tax=Pieris brassicae TaxID=7116 RepID=UPI001E6608BA|nr:uncharacterized protein LOC123714283 [Pieris brassicae]
MLLKIQLIFLFTTQSWGKDHPIIVKLDPVEIIKTLASESSLKYLRKLADVFAKKAAEKFVSEIKNKKYELLHNNHEFLNEPRTTKDKHQKAVLDEEKALELLEKPSPDGDNLDFEQLDSTKEDEESTNAKSIPVFSLMKVNGKYVRRFLGLL